MAMAILSGSSIREIKKAIRQGDAHFLKTIPGIGKKLAERLIVELKEEVGAEEGVSGKEGLVKTEKELLWNDAIQALISLGYRQSVAQEAIRQALSLNSRPLSAEELVKESLKHVSQK
jgi:Holliday junction DNA helicase RuvA